jgi:hypothetical protein
MQHFNGNAQTVGTNRLFATPLKLIIYDSSGTPLPGVPVTFTAPDSGPSGNFAESGARTVTVLSDENGFVSAELQSNNVTGSFIVTAAISGTALTVPFSLTILNIYLSPSGSDTNNDCRSSSAPCKTFQYALSKSTSGVSLYLSGGSYIISNSIIRLEDLLITGGWNAAFTLQNTQTTFRGVGIGIEVRGTNNTFAQILVTDLSTGLDITSTGSVILKNSSVVKNGTGIQNNGTLTILNSTISGNKYVGLNNQSQVTIRNTTFANNIGNALTQSYYHAAVSIENSIIAPTQNCTITAGSITSNGNNLINLDCSSEINPLPTDKIGVNPRLTALVNSSYHALIPGSPAIDAIDTSFCPVDDQRGVSRPSGSRCDIGAYEYTNPGPGSVLLVRSGSPQIAGPLQIPMIPLEVQVIDPVGSPVSNVSVTFTAPSSGASGSFQGSTTAVFFTNESGIASGREFRTNTVPGSYQLQVTATGIAQTVTLAMSNGNSLYVSTNTGSDSTNNCRSSTSPCKTIARAVDQATTGDSIFIAQGNFQAPSLTITKNVFLSGGWNENFSIQNGISLSETSSTSISHLMIDSLKVVSVDRLDFLGGNNMVYNIGTLRLSNGSFRKGCSALYNTGFLEVTNVTIHSNSCLSNSTSGIHNSSGKTVITNVTISNNYGFRSDTTFDKFVVGAGISNYSGLVIAKNSIITNNRANFGFDCSGKIYSSGNNLVGVSDGCKWEADDGDMIGTLQNPVNARLAEFSTSVNGPFVRPLLMDSPAIDAADLSMCPSQDQRGQARPLNSGCDIGAYEGSVSGVPAANAITFTAEYSERLPGKLMCTSPSTSCTGARDTDADSAHQHAVGFFEFLVNQHGRNGVEDAGYPVMSTVHYGSNFDNAFWTDLGRQIVYGNGYPKADDIVAHEITHGITQTTSNLFYYYQSGAINESMSDLWGEYFDQENDIGNDSESVKWLIGEGLPSGSIRNMKNPPAFSDPDRMTSVNYYKGANDNGGVHWNSGVNNKAIFLMVDGGTFNNRTVRALGWEKTAAVYYYAQSRLLTSASDYLDLYHALSQACSALINGKEGISEADCKQVQNAIDAVEMNKSPASGYNPEAAYCPTGTTKFPTDLFMDDFENGFYNWSSQAKIGNPRWGLATGYATSGRTSLYGADYDPTSITGSRSQIVPQRCSIQ